MRSMFSSLPSLISPRVSVPVTLKSVPVKPAALVIVFAKLSPWITALVAMLTVELTSMFLTGTIEPDL